MESIDREYYHSLIQYYHGLIIEWKERALRAETELSAINEKLHAQLRHDPTTGPCPTCGFQVKEIAPKPIVIEEE